MSFFIGFVAGAVFVAVLALAGLAYLFKDGVYKR